LEDPITIVFEAKFRETSRRDRRMLPFELLESPDFASGQLLATTGQNVHFAGKPPLEFR